MLRRALSRWLLKLGALVRQRRKRDVADELASHILQLEDEFLASGMTTREARTAARRRFGNRVRIQETSRELFAFQIIDEFCRDLRVSLRSLRRAPGFAVTAVLTLAVGIAGSVAAFSVINGVLVMPFEDPHRMVVLGTARGNTVRVTLDDVGTYRDRTRVLESVIASRFGAMELDEGGPRIVLGFNEVTPGYFETLGIEPAMGDLFPAGRLPDGTRPVIVSDRLWRNVLDADPEVVGHRLRLRTRSGLERGAPEVFTVAGVLPSSAPRHLASGSVPEVELWFPADPNLTEARPRFYLYGRLNPGETMESAQAEIDVIGPGFANPDEFRIGPLSDVMNGRFSEYRVYTFAAAVAVLFGIALLNVVGLQVSRLAARQPELLVRAALGASRPRLVRATVSEAVILASAGGVVAFAVLYLAQGLILSRIPDLLPRMDRIAVDLEAFAFTWVIAGVAVLTIGIVPALRAARRGASSPIGDAGYRHTDSPGHTRLQQAASFAQMALAVVLLSGAGLLVQGYQRLTADDPRLGNDNVVMLRVELPEQYHSESRHDRFFLNLVDRVRARPGVLAAAATTSVPLEPNAGVFAEFEADNGRATVGVRPGETNPFADVSLIQEVSEDYGTAIGTPLVSGRWLDRNDVVSRSLVAVISEEMTGRLWPGENPLGRRLRARSDAGGNPNPWLVVVGVVASVRNSLSQPTAVVYVPYSVDAFWPEFFNRQGMVVAARIRDGAHPDLASIATQLEPESIVTTASVAETLDTYFRTPRFQMTLIGLLALVAAALAAIGVYGVVSYQTVRRTREIGLRVALGATTREVVALMARRAAFPAVAGVAVGVVTSAGLSRLLESYLYTVQPNESWAYAGGLLVGVALSLVASWIPAKQAARIDPMRALGNE